MNNKEIFDQTGFIYFSPDKLSRRDYFAGMALMGLLAAGHDPAYALETGDRLLKEIDDSSTLNKKP